MANDEKVEVGRIVRDDEAERRANRKSVGGAALDVLAAVADVTFAAGAATTLKAAFGRFTEEKRYELLSTRVGQLEADLEESRSALKQVARLATDYVDSDLFMERALATTARVVREADEEKRRLYALVLGNSCNTEYDRSWYPTALKLLDVLEPVHVEILRELLRHQEKREAGGGEQNTGTRELAIQLHLEELEELRVGGLSEDLPEFFDKKLKGAAAWDEAIGQAGRGISLHPAIKALQVTIKGWDDDILAHIWYIGKEGLVHQETERRSSINELGVRLLKWVRVPEE